MLIKGAPDVILAESRTSIESLWYRPGTHFTDVLSTQNSNLATKIRYHSWKNMVRYGHNNAHSTAARLWRQAQICNLVGIITMTSNGHRDISIHLPRVCLFNSLFRLTSTLISQLHHDDVIKWKHFPRNWPFVREIHRSPVNFPHKGQWCGALMFSLIYAWINDWVNNREAGDLRRQHGHYDVIVMMLLAPCEGNPPVTGGFPSQGVSIAESVCL